MSRTLRKGWLARFLGRETQVPEPEMGAVVSNADTKEVLMGEDPSILLNLNREQAAMIEQLKHQLRMTTASQAAMAKRIQTLKDAWPDLHARFFTTIGDEERATGRKTRTGQKAKRRCK